MIRVNSATVLRPEVFHLQAVEKINVVCVYTTLCTGPFSFDYVKIVVKIDVFEQIHALRCSVNV